MADFGSGAGNIQTTFEVPLWGVPFKSESFKHEGGCVKSVKELFWRGSHCKISGTVWATKVFSIRFSISHLKKIQEFAMKHTKKKSKINKKETSYI